MIMSALLCIGLTSCGGDDNSVSTPPTVPNDGNEQSGIVSNQDPEGTVVVNMNNGSSGNYVDIGIGSSIHIDAANNFVGSNSNVEFASIGEVSGLSKVNSIPTSGWATSIAVTPSTGYVARYLNPYYIQNTYSPYYKYSRIYVVERTINTEGGIMGATVKYQSPFNLLPITLNTTSLSFPYEANTLTLTLKDFVPVTVEEKPEWCTVSVSDITITVSVLENLSPNERQGKIILKNSVNSVTVNITQQASPFRGDGTINNPFSVASAILKCLETGSTPTTKKYYIRGIAAADYTVDRYKNIDVDLVDEGYDGTFKVYHCKGNNGADIPQGYQVKKGDVVIVYGPVVNFNGYSSETATGAYIVSINGVDPASVDPGNGGNTNAAGTENNPFTVAQAIAKCLETGETATSEVFYVKGIVDAAYTVDSYQNATFKLVDSTGDANKFTAYRVKGQNLTPLKEGYVVPKGATVIVGGKLVYYRSITPETEVNTGFIVTVNGQAPEVDE